MFYNYQQVPPSLPFATHLAKLNLAKFVLGNTTMFSSLKITHTLSQKVSSRIRIN